MNDRVPYEISLEPRPDLFFEIPWDCVDTEGRILIRFADDAMTCALTLRLEQWLRLAHVIQSFEPQAVLDAQARAQAEYKEHEISPEDFFKDIDNM